MTLCGISAPDLRYPCVNELGHDGACAPASLNPGSDAAIDAGCICAVLDNNHGRFPPVPAGTWPEVPYGGWYITEGCPLHAPAGSKP